MPKPLNELTPDERKQRLGDREQVADGLSRVANALNDLQTVWETFEEQDVIYPDEWPFDLALEDLTAHVWAKADRIRETNNLASLEPVTMTVPRDEFEFLLAKLDEPARVLPKLKALFDKHMPDDGERWSDFQ